MSKTKTKIVVDSSSFTPSMVGEIAKGIAMSLEELGDVGQAIKIVSAEQWHSPTRNSVVIAELKVVMTIPIHGKLKSEEWELEGIRVDCLGKVPDEIRKNLVRHVTNEFYLRGQDLQERGRFFSRLVHK